MTTESETPKRGKLTPMMFGDKVLSVYRKCTCGGGTSGSGSVNFTKNPDGNGSTATCTVCGATMKFGGTWTLENQDISDVKVPEK